MNKEIGLFISKLRKEMNLTQEELAKRLNVTKQAISRWETGKGLPDINLLSPLAKELGITVNELLNGKRNEELEENSSNNSIQIIIEEAKKKVKTQRVRAILISMIVIALLTVGFTYLYREATIVKHSFINDDIKTCAVVYDNGENSKITLIIFISASLRNSLRMDSIQVNYPVIDTEYEEWEEVKELYATSHSTAPSVYLEEVKIYSERFEYDIPVSPEVEEYLVLLENGEISEEEYFLKIKEQDKYFEQFFSIEIPWDDTKLASACGLNHAEDYYVEHISYKYVDLSGIPSEEVTEILYGLKADVSARKLSYEELEDHTEYQYNSIELSPKLYNVIKQVIIVPIREE